ncbi:hypothetical protein [Streptobacillus moniliformis]|uniref:hypothetical protein n=1 Tax=Streptobacillus moniliformis TaxID=34105 RepID=UPI0007EED3E5|nr:hypothetical protein [Streptobacillus moniliformis]
MSGGGLISLSNNFTGPRYRVDISTGFIDDRRFALTSGYKFFSGSVSVLPEWELKFNKKFDISFGPKVSLNFENFIGSMDATTINPSIILGGEIDFNYKVIEDVKIYAGMEVGTGIGFQAFVSSSHNYFQGPELKTESKISLGVKVKDKFNLAFYTGDIKGVIGVEAGYTF